MLDADADAVLCEDDVLAAHALGRGLAHLNEGEVDLVEDPAAAAEEGDGDDEGDDLAGAERKMHVSSGCLFCLELVWGREVREWKRDLTPRLTP